MMKELELKHLIATKVKSVNPIKFKDEDFELYSIPAYSKLRPEVVKGEAIGSSKKLLVSGDILLSRIVPHIRRCWIVPEVDQKRKIGSGEWIVFRSSRIEPVYLKYFLLSDYFHFRFMKTVKGVGGSLLRADPKLTSKIKIPLPSLATQKKIAAILDAAAAHQQKTKALLAKYEELAQSIFLEMFGDPITNPRGWEVKKAYECIELLTGFPFKSKDYSDNPNHIKLCGGLIIMPWGIDWTKSNKWNPEQTNKLNRYWLEAGDIVLAMDRPWISSGFKICMIADEDLPSLLVQRTARIRTGKINKTFLYFLYKDKSFERHARPTETTVPHISPKDINGFDLIWPPMKLQQEFELKIENIKTQRKKLRSQLANSENLFNSLLQKAFKGELVQ